MVSVDSQALIDREEKRFTVKGMPHLQLKTFDGAIEIRSWERSEVLVEIEKRGATREAVDALVVQADQDGDRIVVDVKKPAGEAFHGFGFHHSASAKLIVSVPRRSDVSAHSGDGSIRIEGVAGRLELETGDGSIRASDVEGDMTLHTGDGSVNVSGAQGQLDVDTGDGSVEVAGSLVAVKLRSGDGSIVYRAGAATTMSDDWDISTGDGSITLYLPPDFSGEVDARTSDGMVRNELRAGGLPAEADTSARPDRDRDRDETSRRSMRMRLGGGGKVLKIRTGDGTIRLRSS
jgi:DUF4097 and DUF4098 domain-containing protein YvlB